MTSSCLLSQLPASIPRFNFSLLRPSLLSSPLTLPSSSHRYRLSFVNLLDLGVSRDSSTGNYWRLNDIWGWVDPVTGQEWAIVGSMDGTSFVDVTDAVHPVVVAWLPTYEGTVPRTWRDIKVFKDHAFIVEDNSPHGLQIVDMVGMRQRREEHFRRCEPTAVGTSFPGITKDWCATNCQDGAGALAAACSQGTEVDQLCECDTGYETIKEDVHYFEFEDCHNLFITQETGILYGVGTSTCGAGPHMVDVNDPKNPKFLGCVHLSPLPPYALTVHLLIQTTILLYPTVLYLVVIPLLFFRRPSLPSLTFLPSFLHPPYILRLPSSPPFPTSFFHLPSHQLLRRRWLHA
jgi:hypothetical protein